ncbi:MAG: sigma factor, partial [Stenotrophomonas sp.]
MGNDDVGKPGPPGQARETMMEPAGHDQPGHDFAARAVHDYSTELHRYLRRRVNEAQDLGDLVQEVYLRLLRVQNIETVRNPLAYIYGIAAHVASEFNMRQRQ